MTVKFLLGDCRGVLAALPAGSVQCVDMSRQRIEDKAGLFGEYAWGLDA
jgi:hypothetical protein